MIARDHICIVDDDEVMCFVHESLAQNTGFFNTINTFSDSSEALDWLTHSAEQNVALPAYILLDLNMPKVSGWDFIGRLESLTKEFPKLQEIQVVVVTTSNLQEDQNRAAKLPLVTDFYSKPLPQEAFADFIEQ